MPLREDPSVCPIVPCVSLAQVSVPTTQPGFEQISPYHVRLSWPARFRYLTRLTFSHHAPVPSILSVKVRCCFNHINTSGVALLQLTETRLSGARMQRLLSQAVWNQE